jgi:NAD(P)-dependent dehydrogenase (short-subunit alcohol dehydrogenase family)
MGIEDRIRFDGKRVLVTGAASGMGEAAAGILSGLGAEVHTLDINKPKESYDGFFEVDLKSPTAIEEAASAFVAGGAVDVLFSCAGVAQTFPPLDVFLINFVGNRALTEALHMPRGGVVSIISSGAGVGYQMNMENIMTVLAIPDFAGTKAWAQANMPTVREGYSLSKECLIVYTQMRGMQVATEQGIRMNCIAPGPTDTGMMPAIVSDMGEDYMNAFPKPLLGRNATPAEQAWPLVLLASDPMNIVSGNVLWTDQGFAGGLFTGQVDLSILMPPTK